MLNISNESRALQGPWTTLVKGRGLGAISKNFNIDEANDIKNIFNIVDKSYLKSNPYHLFTKALCNFILDFNNPQVLFFQRKELHAKIDEIIHLLQQIDDTYQYISASAILFESIGKLGLDPNIWSNKNIYLVEDALNKLDELPSANEQECYKTLQAYGNLFLGIAHIGQVNKLTTGDNNYVEQALQITAGLDGVWHRGRAVAAFLTILGMIGLADYATSTENNHLRNLVEYMHSSLADKQRVQQRTNEYVFSILLMINAFAVLDKLQYLEYKQDWIKLAGELIEILPLNLKVIFNHYYLSALDNLGLTHKHTKNPKAYLDKLIENLLSSPDSELDYMAYTYCVDIAHKLDVVDVISNAMLNRFIENISTEYDFKNGHAPTNLFYRSAFMRIAYSLTAFSQLSCAGRLLETNQTNNKCLVESLINNHIENWQESDDSYLTLHHALVDLSLSQRGADVASSKVDNNVVLNKKINNFELTNAQITTTQADKIAVHGYFPGMNSRRQYNNISRELYEKGNEQVRKLFETSAEILNQQNTANNQQGVSRFFFEDAIRYHNIAEKWNHIGSSMTVYNLALLEHFKTASANLYVNSVGGESYGMIAAAIASNALSLEDGLKIANMALGCIYQHAHASNIGLWHIVSLTGQSIQPALEHIKQTFPQQIDVFRWQTLNSEQEEVHLYIHQTVLHTVEQLLKQQFGDAVVINEFKRPTIEIVHSPRLAPARVDISNFIVEQNICFADPDMPIVANNGTGIALSKDEVRNLILDMVNIPMYSAQSFRSLSALIPNNTDAIVEFGYGEKTRPFVENHQVKQAFFEYFGNNKQLQTTLDSINRIKNASNSQSKGKENDAVDYV